MVKRNRLWLLLLFTAACLLFFIVFFLGHLIIGNQEFEGSFLGTSAVSDETPDTQNWNGVGLPGLKTREIITWLSQQAYQCTEPEADEQSIFHWICWKEDSSNLLEIYFFSRSADSIDFIDANINQPDNPSDQDAVAFLTFIGTLPENDSEDERIAAWISEVLPTIEKVRDLRENDFGGIHYRLYGTAEARSLEIGNLP